MSTALPPAPRARVRGVRHARGAVDNAPTASVGSVKLERFKIPLATRLDPHVRDSARFGGRDARKQVGHEQL